MHWEWVLPVIFLIVWIVSSLIQGNERERARNNRSKSLPGGERQPGERTTRRPPSDIDRFLEEVNRRRRQAAAIDHRLVQPAADRARLQHIRNLITKPDKCSKLRYRKPHRVRGPGPIGGGRHCSRSP